MPAAVLELPSSLIRLVVPASPKKLMRPASELELGGRLSESSPPAPWKSSVWPAARLTMFVMSVVGPAKMVVCSTLASLANQLYDAAGKLRDVWRLVGVAV